MERLTKRFSNGGVGFPSELVNVTLTPDNKTMYKLLTRLSAYEDTGLEPEEIRELAQAKQDGRLPDRPGGRGGAGGRRGTERSV